MAKVLKRVRKSSEKAAFTLATAAKTHKKNMKLNIRGRKSIPTSKLVISKKSPKSKAIKDKVFAVSPIEVSSNNEKNKNKKKKKKKKKKENDEKKKNNDDVEKINASFIAQKLFDQKNRKIIDFKRRVNDVKKNYVNILNISNFEKNEIISSANKKDVNKIFTLITKMYILT